MRFMGGIKELITILSYHPERAITSKYIADTLSILKITASLCHQRWHQKVKFRPLAHGLRVVVFVGGLILGTGSVLNALATSTEYLFFSYTIVAGKTFYVWLNYVS